jgi:hypothetical protein
MTTKFVIRRDLPPMPGSASPGWQHLKIIDGKHTWVGLAIHADAWPEEEALRIQGTIAGRFETKLEEAP